MAKTKPAPKAKSKDSWLCWVTKVLLIVGGLNWGLVGAFNYNLVDALLGMGSLAGKVVYVLVGLAALHKLWWLAQKK
ncbi:DUF378 domain-containing protein [Candidatus Woesearchaeota archaeon]|nr:DUF378 domain-containing protein [Candidatus Woesearchaeota archaeon]